AQICFTSWRACRCSRDRPQLAHDDESSGAAGRGVLTAPLSALTDNSFRRVSTDQFTTFWSFPQTKLRTFSTAIRINRERAALVAHARCGVMMQFLAVRSGLPPGGG